MPRKKPERDPIGSYARKVVGTKRVGKGARCACGETRTEALIPNTKPIICARCKRIKKGKSVLDDHHVAGVANSPVTVPVPVNDHRARLSVEQYEWPAATLRNPDANELLAAAAAIRGYIDTNLYLTEKLLGPVAELLERLAASKASP